MALSYSLRLISCMFAMICLDLCDAIANDEGTFYIQGNVNCSATENLGNIPKIICGARCSTKDGPCIGFSHNQTNCELCMVCPISSNHEPLNSHGTTYSSALSFAVELDKGLFEFHLKDFLKP